jgi:hypothetical protein
MKLSQNHLRWSLPAAIVVIGAFALVAWTGSPQQPGAVANQNQDTIPKRLKETRRSGDKDLDKELRDLDNAQGTLDKEDWDKIQFDVDKAMKDIDMNKISQQIKDAMASVDVDKIQSDVRAALKNIDMNKIKMQVDESLRSIDCDKLREEINSSLDKVDIDKIKYEAEKAGDEVRRQLKDKDWKKEMEDAQKDIDHAREELKHEKFDMKDIMDKAGEGIANAKEELQGYQDMIYSMENDGLLSTKEDYVIKYRNGELSVNGKKQSQEVTDKYRKYFKKDKVTIRKEDGEMHINNGDSNVHID